MQIEHLNKETTGGTVRNLDALYQLFPSCFTEAQDAVTGKMHALVFRNYFLQLADMIVFI